MADHSWQKAIELVEELIEAQKKSLLACGRRLVPTLTPEDMLQPNDYVELEHAPHFRYEEGYLAGLLSVQMALLAGKKEEEWRSDESSR